MSFAEKQVKQRVALVFKGDICNIRGIFKGVEKDERDHKHFVNQNRGKKLSKF